MNRTKKIMIAAVELAILICGPAHAQITQLSCSLDTGQSAGNVVIDTVAGTMTHGDGFTHQIVSNTDEFLTALSLNGSAPGGTLWVIERASGNFAVSSAGLFCTTGNCEGTRPSVFTMTGTCVPAVF